jgi:hypothetical protein
MDYRKPQELQSLELSDYEIRICVNGTRHWADKKTFHAVMIEVLEDIPDGTNIIFISGDAATGADALIIAWCRKFGFPCKRMPADWEASPRGAGYIRNTQMSECMTRLISFWDGVSRGTKHLIDLAIIRNLPVRIVNIEMETAA